MIEIFAIHIEKTGGSSFIKMLESIYGSEKVAWFNRAGVKKILDSGKPIDEYLPDKVSILSGHFYYAEAKAIVEIYDPKIILWLRDPVERVVSNYVFWSHRVTINPKHPVRDRMGEPIELYITRKETRNKIHKALKGMDLSDAYFIGFLESFDEDLKKLAEKLQWPEIPNFHEKNSKNFDIKKPKIDRELRKKILKLNKKDIEIYNKALALTSKKKVV
jgi:hypothetical protein